MKLSGVQQERFALDSEVQAGVGAFDEDTSRTMHSYNSKKTNIDKMKQDMDRMEKETAEKLKEIDETNAKLSVSVQ